MTKVLLTGGSGFIAAHILEQLLEKGHQVVTTVRSEEKAQKIRDAYPDKKESELKVVLVPDASQEDAFDEVVKDHGLEVVLHTASPFHYNFKDPQKEIVDPALNGTRGILKAIVRSAPSVRRVVITSSFAAILSETKLQDPNTTFTEKSWNPDGLADIHRSQATAYRVSKLMAEHYAWDFVADKSNGAKFDVVTVNPPTVFGPVVNYLASLDAINTSNARIVDCVQGKWKENGPAKSGPVCSWIDVRDVAKAHVRAGLELPNAGGHRLFTTAGIASNRELVDVVRRNFPELRDRLPDESIKGGEMPPADTMYKVDNSETKKILGFEWTPFETSIVDTVKSLKKFL